MNKYRHFLLLVLAMVISLGTNAMQIFVNIPSNEQLTLDVEPSDSFENVLEKIHDKRPLYQTQYMTIYFNNQPCNDLLQTLADRNVQKESTLVMEYNDNPGIQVTQDNNLDWNFIMPDHNARVDVEYYPSTLTLAADGNGTVCFRHFTVASIQVGDTLCAGDYFEGQINFMSDRIKYNGNIPQPNQMIPDYMSQTTSFGIDGLIVATGGLQDKYYAPATESGDDGNAWVVTSKNEQGITIAGVQATNTLPAGVVANDNGTYFIDYNISVTLLAVPKAGSYVKNWDNDEDVNSGGDTPKTYTQITQNFTATAHFTESPTLTLAADGNGTVELGGIVSVTNFFDNGSTIQINGRIIDNNIGFSVKYRNDNGNFTLVSNTGGIQSISFNKDGDALVYTAQAAGDNASWMTLTINTAGNTIAAQGYGDWSNYGFWFSSIEVNDVTLSIRYGSNIVNSLPAGIVATETVGQYIVSPGTEVTIKATANPGYHMASWSNNVEVNSLTEATQIFTMGTSDTTITANFIENTYTVILNDGDVDANNWKGKVGDNDTVAFSAFPLEDVKAAQTITVKYDGARKVKSIRAKVNNSEPVTLATPLTLEAITDGNIVVNSPKVGMQYSLNGGAKTAVTTSAINVVAGDKVQFYGNGTNITSYSGTTISGGTAQVKIYGNIMSLVDETEFATATVLFEDYAFKQLFKNYNSLTDASGLNLPATSLTVGCYTDMFYYCENMASAPALLPATTLAPQCYYWMFRNCVNLVATPALPATTVGELSCYQMFYGCSSMTTVPDTLPATTLASQCFSGMFSGCYSLATAPALPATTLAVGCYTNMFYMCSSLTTAPTLPAPTLPNQCYRNMFSYCTQLNSVTCLATTFGVNSTNNWLDNVAASGIFTAQSDTVGWQTNSPHGIPTGWTRENRSVSEIYELR